MFKVETGNNVYMTTRKVKWDNSNLFYNNYTTDKYLKKFLSNIQSEKQKDCGVWLDDGTVMSEPKTTKGSYINWDTEDTADIEKSGEATTENIKAMVFLQQLGSRYDGLRCETENNMSKGRYEYPTTVISAYNLMLE